MSFDISGLGQISVTGVGAPRWWTYKKATDTKSTIVASGYFNSVMQNLTTGVGMFAVGDVIHVHGSDGYGLYRVSAVTTAVTVAAYQIAAILDGVIENADLGDNIITADEIYHNAEAAMELSDALKLIPVRATADYGYLFKIDGGSQMTGGAAQKTWAITAEVSRPVGSPATGDSNDAIVRGTYSNYAPCDSNFIMRGVNMSMRNRSGGTLGRIDGGMFGAKNDSGGTAPYVLGAQFIPENYGSVATEFGGVECLLKNEANTATLSYGIKIRNGDLSAQPAIQHGVLIQSDATNGFTNAVTVKNACVNFANFDDSTGTVCTQTGTEATTWAARIKVITPDGSAGYINVYSTSNA